jgi:hypothetical protein
MLYYPSYYHHYCYYFIIIIFIIINIYIIIILSVGAEREQFGLLEGSNPWRDLGVPDFALKSLPYEGKSQIIS